ncbi:antibiotic synthesis protein MbtH [Streptomyces sp. CB03234]|uniref:MbtH family protein n=1 Tax=Streptomyces sp. (strain CB03234) TaxID=1703937 RepID=UPI000939C641|nr:MbtH family NRPS accessory protein [Streptomyces sp. CB03234]OKK08055.1 antibiotic synthesis protein MbtH [Streptomyces sp. CB03234]
MADHDSTPAAPTTYAVVLNEEEQYSIWDVALEMPDGWHAEGFSGSKDDCLAHIESVWTDLRPRSMRAG